MHKLRKLGLALVMTVVLTGSTVALLTQRPLGGVAAATGEAVTGAEVIGMVAVGVGAAWASA